MKNICKWAYRAIVPSFLSMVVIFIVLNKFRSPLYSSGINNSNSAYSRVITVQLYVERAALLLLPFALVIVVYEIVHWVFSKFSN